jgi:hypothetical protein
VSLALVLLPAPVALRRAAAQDAPPTPRGSVFQRLGLDKLQLTGVGLSAGPVYPAKSLATQAYSVHGDYGMIARDWRVVFVVTYWGSELRRDVVDRFGEQIRRSVVDPAGDDTVQIGRVTISDVALETDLRWSPLPGRVIRPYGGVGVGAHVINAENKFIAGTFVESALDNIAAGLTGIAGVDLALGRALSVGAQGRYTLLSTVRFASLRLTGSYSFHLAKPSRSS